MIEKYKKELCILIIILIPIIYLYITKNKEDIEIYEEEIISSQPISGEFYVDLKGAVKKPGVYKFKEGQRVIDAIEKAEGLTKSADTSNINLSQKLTSEMVVYIYTSKEIKSTSNNINCSTSCNTQTIEVNNCVKEDTNKININTATKEQLMTLNSIGESKADTIIKHRNETPFKTIEDIKNISGIGDAIFDKIKESITV